MQFDLPLAHLKNVASEPVHSRIFDEKGMKNEDTLFCDIMSLKAPERVSTWTISYLGHLAA